MPKIKAALLLVLVSCWVFLVCACGEQTELSSQPETIDGLSFEERVPLKYAQCYAIDRYKGGYSILHIEDGSRFLLVPEGGSTPENLDEKITVIKKPVDNVYMAATSVMGLFDGLECCSQIKYSGTQADGWYIENAKKALENGEMIFAGKYSMPDYELLINGGCSLAIESTMIEHTPDVKEKLEELGINVLVDHSSYESHPLGRSEWIKLYGELLDRPEQAEQLFDEQADKLEKIDLEAANGKTAVYFYINSSGQVVTRRSNDYITKMIELAGGSNILNDVGGEGFSAVKLDWESFYGLAKDADYIIYNGTIDGEMTSVNELLEKNELFSDFKAVKNGNVWCTNNNLYQESMKLGDVICDFNSVFSDTADAKPPQYLYKLKAGG